MLAKVGAQYLLCEAHYQQRRQHRRRDHQPWRQRTQQRASLTGEGVLIGFVTMELAGEAMVEPVAKRPKPAAKTPAMMSERIFLPPSPCSMRALR